MKTLIATLLATAAGASFAAAPTFGLNHDPATYRNVSEKAAADYKTAVAKCENVKGNDKDVCIAEAKVARTRSETDALARYNNSPKGREKVRTDLANAEYDLAKARCGAKSGAEKDECLNTAKSVHTAALADAKAGANGAATTGANGATNMAAGASAAGATAAGALVTRTDTRDPVKAGAVDKCAQVGDAKTGCLVETKPSAVRENAAEAADVAAEKTRAATAVAADKTKAAAAVAAEKTKEVAEVAADKTKAAAAVVAQKTDTALDRAADKTAEQTADVRAKGRAVVADTAITTKVKAGLVKEPDLQSLGIHVETEKGVVMLSGFVRSNTEAEKAVKVAKGIEGVTNVKSAILVK
jgi:hyperosmotically inducible protein